MTIADKIKNVLSPGHKQDDETLHSDPSTSATTSGVHSGTTGTSGVPEGHGERKSSIAEGVGRQVFNPNGEKYSEASYGAPGSHTAVEQLPPSVGADDHLYTDPAAKKKEHSVLRQILNPHGDKYDETRFGQTASTQPPKITEDTHDSLREGTGASGVTYATPGAHSDHTTGHQSSTPIGAPHGQHVHYGGATTGSDLAYADGTRAPVAGSTVGSSAVGGSTVDSSTAGSNAYGSNTYGSNTTGSSTVGGSTVGGAYATGSGETPSTYQPTTGASTRTMPDEGLTHHQHNQFYNPSHHGDAATGAATGKSITHHHHDHDERNAALAGGAAGVATHEARHNHDAGATPGGLSHHVHNDGFQGIDPSARNTAPTTTGASTSTGTATGENLPSVPNTGGKFLGEQSGEYPHASTGERSFPLSGGTTSGSYEATAGNDGRRGLAAAAGAATVASAGSALHESSRFDNHEHGGFGHQYRGASIDGTPPPQGPQHATRTASLLDPNAPPVTPTKSGFGADAYSSADRLGSESSPSHHGRDAALAGGAVGAAGLGAYEASKHHGDTTGPAPNTIGPHDKDWKNVLDPRVKPQPELMKSSGPDASGPAPNTIGQHDKDWKNVVDPRVQPDPTFQKPSSVVGNTGPASNTLGPHDKDWKNIADPRVQPQPELQKGDRAPAEATGVAHPTSQQARDAGLVGGAGALGAAGLAHHQSPQQQPTSSAAPGTAVSTSGQHAYPAPTSTTPDTTSSTQHHGTRDVAAAGGAGAAAIAATRAFQLHEQKKDTPVVVGEKGSKHHEANPYSSQTIDPRVDGHRGSSGSASSSPTSTHKKGSLFSRMTGSSSAGAHETSTHHGQTVSGEGLGAHDPSTHHGISSTATGTLGSDRATGAYPSPDDSKLEKARERESQHAHDMATSEPKKRRSILGFLHRDKKDKHDGSTSTSSPTATAHDESALAPHLHQDQRNKLHKEPPHGYPEGPEGTTIGTGSGITAETLGPGDGEATTTGRQMGA